MSALDRSRSASTDPLEVPDTRRDLRRARRAARRATRPDAPTRLRHRRGFSRFVWPVLVSVVFVGVLFVAVFPTQTYFAQRDLAGVKAEELEELEADTAELRAEVDRLSSDAYVELAAKEEYGLVFPGEEAYGIRELDPDVEATVPAESTVPAEPEPSAEDDTASR